MSIGIEIFLKLSVICWLSVILRIYLLILPFVRVELFTLPSSLYFSWGYYHISIYISESSTTICIQKYKFQSYYVSTFLPLYKISWQFKKYVHIILIMFKSYKYLHAEILLILFIITCLSNYLLWFGGLYGAVNIVNMLVSIVEWKAKFHFCNAKISVVRTNCDEFMICLRFRILLQSFNVS